MKHRFLAATVALSAAASAHAAHPRFVDFVVGNAHDRGFTQCDAAIRDAFAHAAGDDVRVITFQGEDRSSLRMVAVYGSPGDVVYTEAEFTRAGGRCRYSLNHTIVSNRSRAAEMAALPAFRFENETVGVVFTRNEGGVDRLLIPAGPAACTAIFIRDGEA